MEVSLESISCLSAEAVLVLVLQESLNRIGLIQAITIHKHKIIIDNGFRNTSVRRL